MIRVLIVEDAPLIRQSLAIKAESWNDTTVVAGTAANGKQALEWLEQNYADICMTDVRMPMMDGLELIKHVNEKYPWMVSFLISSYSDFEYAKQSLELNAVDYVLKPVEQQALNVSLGKAASKLAAVRNSEAAAILVRKLPLHRGMLDRWMEHVRSIRIETMPLMVVDTLEMLEDWVEERYWLLNPLAMAWLQMVVDELSTERFSMELHEGKDLGLGEAVLSRDKIRPYFRLCAVRRLEEGAHRLFKVMKGLQENQTTKLIDHIQKYVQDHYATITSLQDLANVVNMSKNYMSNLYKQETGMTVWGYVVSVRMKQARELLLNTDLKNYEISSRVGYEDSTHFSQLFKEYYGLSPSEYKKRMEK